MVKKVLITLGVLLIVVIAALAVAPMIFKDEISCPHY